MLALVVFFGSAITFIFPSETKALNECKAVGAGASSMSPLQTLKHASSWTQHVIHFHTLRIKWSYTSMPWAAYSPFEKCTIKGSALPWLTRQLDHQR